MNWFDHAHVFVAIFLAVAVALPLIVFAFALVFRPDLVFEPIPEPSKPPVQDWEQLNFAIITVRGLSRDEYFVLIVAPSETHRVSETVQAWADDPELPFSQVHADHITQHIQSQLKGVC